MLYVDKAYINRMSPILKRFKWISGSIANCRCPLCGDSTKNESKSRGYFTVRNQDYIFTCHNCQSCHTLKTFIKMVSPNLLDEYRLECFKESGGKKFSKKQKDATFEDLITMPSHDPLSLLTPISKLKSDHICRKYVEDRKIPSKFYDILYFSENYAAWAEEIEALSGKSKNSKKIKDDERLVIPIIDPVSKKFVGAQGRTLITDKNPRYITVKVVEDIESFWYGMERVNTNSPVIVMEGPLNSLFVDNAVAMLGMSKKTHTPDYLKKLKKIYVLDNQPWHKDVIGNYASLINRGETVSFFDDGNHWKDVNDMVRYGGMTSEEIKDSIMRNACDGPEATLKLYNWRKNNASRNSGNNATSW
jgi:hypothetical protein